MQQAFLHQRGDLPESRRTRAARLNGQSSLPSGPALPQLK